MDKAVTYAELQDKVVRCAIWLQQQGMKAGDVVSVCSSNQLDAIVPCLAAAYLNVIFNPWNEDMDLSEFLKTDIEISHLTILQCTYVHILNY